MVFRSDATDKKLFTLRYTKKEFAQIETAAQSVGLTVEELIKYAIKNLKD
jgi:hypothetical protein